MTTTTIAKLKALTSPVTTTRYFLSDPGKEGFFKYDAADKTTPDDGMNCIVSTNGKRFKRILFGAGLLTTAVVVQPEPTPISVTDPVIVTGKIPLYPLQLWEHINGDDRLNGLIDGNIEETVIDGWGKNKTAYPYPILYEFPKDQKAKVSYIRFYDKMGDDIEANATIISYSTLEKPFEFIDLYKYYGQAHGQWTKLDINANVRFIRLLVKNYKIPNELEAYGTYDSAYKLPELKQPKTTPFKNLLGANGHIWDILGPNINGQWVNSEVDPKKLNIISKAFRVFRLYVQKERIEVAQGRWEFAPTSAGGWDYDKALTALKGAGVEVLFDAKELPLWQQQLWPQEKRRGELRPTNTPTSNPNLPESYTADAETYFQIAARYGRNKVDVALLKTPDKKTGLNLLTYIEHNNETNAYWEDDRYQTAYQYIVNLSVVYDAVKKADPTMKVVMAGTAGADYYYMRGLLYAAEQLRGRNADGSINVPFDAINYHCYQNNATIPPYPVIWDSKAVSPEKAELRRLQNGMEYLRQNFCPQVEIWQTETGYDIHPQSLGTPAPLPGKTIDQTVAILELRTAFEYAATGLRTVCWYMMQDVNWSGAPYCTSGLVDGSFNPRLKTIFLQKAAEIMGDFSFTKWVHELPFYLAEYSLGTAKKYVAWYPSEIGKTSIYNPGRTVKIYTITDGGTIQQTTGTSVEISEKPIIFE
jgi:endoglucanase